MTLKITLKPGEAVFIGAAEVKIMTKSICTIEIDGDAPVLRSDYAIGAVEAVDTPSRLHFVLQRMYLTGDIKAYHAEYFALAQAFINENPAASAWIQQTNQFLIEGETYQAVKFAKRFYPVNKHRGAEPEAEPDPRYAGVAHH
jgi:flagellar biosynthesis regulator FlbT